MDRFGNFICSIPESGTECKGPSALTSVPSFPFYLYSMSAPLVSSSPENPSSFAALLASITARPSHKDGWDDSALADDVATISYEEALKHHRRVPSLESATEALPHHSLVGGAEPPTGHLTPYRDSKSRKNASITLRLTLAEQAQLHERASAAQLSVSAYIRSCIFEAESLRAQVKEALAQMQTSCQIAPPATPQKPPRNWHKRLFPRWSRGHAAEG